MLRYKYLLISLAILFFPFGTNAQTFKNYSLKGEALYGTILKHNKHLENLAKEPSKGASLSIEWQTMGEQPWHQYFNFPAVGISATYIDLGNPEMLGQVIALHPYLQIPIIRTKFATLNMKPSAGLSFVTKYYGNTPHQENSLNGLNGESNGANAAIGSMLNVFLAFGGNLEVPITKSLSLTADYAWNHVSNGSIVQPNSGINMMNAYVGVKFRPDAKTFSMPAKTSIPDIDRKIQFEVSLSGGVRQLYYQDQKYYPIGTFTFAAYKPLSNFYKMGVGIDAFYDGVYGAVNYPETLSNKTTNYKRTYITSDKFGNKIRVGASWQHEFMLGRFTAGFHLGLYLYDPIKDLEPIDLKTDKLNSRTKGLIYAYNIDVEDGWFYTRAVAKYNITNHLIVQVGLKTHLQKAEFIEWGLGYRF